jgi:hypothetical protein
MKLSGRFPVKRLMVYEHAPCFYLLFARSSVMKYSIKTAIVFKSIFSTKSGLPVKEMRFNAVLNVWLGTVSGVPHAWNIEGRCIDRDRPELDLS